MTQFQDDVQVTSRTLGRLEGQTASLSSRLLAIETRLDRLIFSILGLGIGLATGVVVLALRLFLGP